MVYKWRDLNSDTNRSEYSRLNKLVKTISKIDDNNWALTITTDLEEEAGNSGSVKNARSVSNSGKR